MTKIFQFFFSTDTNISNPPKSKRADDNGPLETVVNQLTQKVTQLEADFSSIQNSDNTQNSQIDLARSSTYTRWGHSHCNNGSETVYSGVIGLYIDCIFSYNCFYVSPNFLYCSGKTYVLPSDHSCCFLFLTAFILWKVLMLSSKS